MAKPHPTDARARPFTQVRLYGELADMIEQRAELEGKSRSTLVDELLRIAWNTTTEPSPLLPDHRFQRTPLPGNVFTAPPPPPQRPRAHVFAPRP